MSAGSGRHCRFEGDARKGVLEQGDMAIEHGELQRSAEPLRRAWSGRQPLSVITRWTPNALAFEPGERALQEGGGVFLSLAGQAHSPGTVLATPARRLPLR